MSSFIKVKDLCYRYRQNMDNVLEGVNFEIERGEFIALVGHNGSGKTTLAKIIVGLLEHKEGIYQFTSREGKVLSRRELRKKIGMVSQEPNNQILESTVFKEVAYGLREKGMAEPEINDIVEDILHKMNLYHVRKRHPYLLSRGQRKRVALASIVVLEPELIICDEPTAALDYSSSTTVMESLVKPWKQGATIIFITHDVKIVAEYAQRTILLNKGQVAIDTDVRSFFMDHHDELEEHNFITPQITELANRLNRVTGRKLASVLRVSDFVDQVVN